MRTHTQIIAALRKVRNVADFARRHKLAERTIWNVRQGEPARAGTLLLLDFALNEEAKGRK